MAVAVVEVAVAVAVAVNRVGKGGRAVDRTHRVQKRKNSKSSLGQSHRRHRLKFAVGREPSKAGRRKGRERKGKQDPK